VAYLLLAIIFVAIYVVHFLPGMKDSKLRKILEVKTILLVVLIFVAIIAARMEKIAEEMDKRNDIFIETVDDALRGKGLAKIREFESASDLYGELIAAQKRSNKEIRLGRLRAMSADDLLTDPNLFYKNIWKWLDAAPGRVLYRVVNVAGDGMERWFEKECNRKSRAKNLGMKRIEGKSNVPRLNFAVFDHREVFIMTHPLSAPTPLGDPFEATKAVHIEDPVFATYMAAYFDQIFEVATGCSGK
jgi:hypothetical protein